MKLGGCLCFTLGLDRDHAARVRKIVAQDFNNTYFDPQRQEVEYERRDIIRYIGRQFANLRFISTDTRGSIFDEQNQRRLSKGKDGRSKRLAVIWRLVRFILSSFTAWKHVEIDIASRDSPPDHRHEIAQQRPSILEFLKSSSSIKTSIS